VERVLIFSHLDRPALLARVSLRLFRSQANDGAYALALWDATGD